MCLCNKGCGFDHSHTTGLHDTWSACVKNNQPFNLPSTHTFQKKIVAASGTVPQVASNNGGSNQSPPTTNGVTDPDPVVGLHHMGDDVLGSQYVVQTKYVF